MALRQLGPLALLSTETPNLDTSNSLPDYAKGLNLKNRFDGPRGIYNYKASNTRILDQGLGNCMVGGQTRHLIIGDSVSAGAISGIGVPNYDRLHAWPLCMRDSLATMGVLSNGTGFVRANDADQVSALAIDPRWGLSSNWNAATVYSYTTVSGSWLTFTTDRGGSIAEVGYLDTGSATVTISVDGATSGVNFKTFTTTSAGGTWKKARLTGATIKIGSVVKITVTTAGTGFGISGIGIWQPNAGLIVDNVAQSGSYAQGTGLSSWSDATGGPYFVYKDVSGRKRTVLDGASTAGSPTFTSATAAFTQLDEGEPIDQFPTSSGIQYPPNTYIKTYVNATTVTMSNNALQTLTGQKVQISRDPSCIHLALGGNDMMGYGAAGIPAMITALTTIRNRYPNSDCILHLENEPSPTLATAAVELAFQQAIYSLADTLDVPLYDWRDRAGNYTTAFNNGMMNDYQAHMTPATYESIGASLAIILGGGGGQPQRWTAPIWEGDLTNKAYTDAKDFAPLPPFQQAGTLTVKTGTNKWYNDTGRTLTLTKVRASVVTAPTGASIIIDINKNGTTLYTTQANRPTIAVSGTTVVATLPDILTLASGDYVTIDIDQIGSTVAGADLTVQLTGLVV